MARYTAQRGFSLAELMVSLLVLSIIATMTTFSFVALDRARAEATRRADVAERGRVIVELLSNELKASVTLPAGTERRSGHAPTRYRMVGVDREYPGTTVDIVAMADTRGPSLNRNEDIQYDPASGDNEVDEDPWNGVDDDGDGIVDEDPGTIPRDMINFVAASLNTGQLDVVEVGYTLSALTALDDPTGYRSDRLYRRYDTFTTDTSELSDEDRRFGYYTNESGKLEDFVTQESFFSSPGRLESGEVELIDYDVVGLDFFYWYWDYELEQWASARQWDSGIDQSSEPLEWAADYNTNNFGERIQNRPKVYGADDYDTEADGLPYMVEVRVFLQDNLRTYPPRMFSGRVYLPSG